MSTNISTLEAVGTRSIAEIRKDGIDKQMLQRVAQERAEMQRVKEQVNSSYP